LPGSQWIGQEHDREDADRITGTLPGRSSFRGRNIQDDLVGYRKCLGYVPEEPNLYPYLSGLEYLEMVATLRGMSRAKLDHKIDELLSLFSLHPHRHASIASYSKGMRQRILLIASIVDNPDLLIFDEPLSGLDVTSALVFRHLIKALGEHGKAVFYCSHVLEVVEKVCSHLLILRKGAVLAYAPAAELQRETGKSSLEHSFVHLMEEGDATKITNDIVEVMSAP